jgi:hypothetical protein
MRLIAVGALLSLVSPTSAAAEESLAALDATLDPLALLGAARARLLPGFSSAGSHHGGGLRPGPIFGIELGPATAVPSASADTELDFDAGLFAGYGFGNGLALLGHLNVLGTHPLLFPAPRLGLLTAGLRYEFPNLPVLPFAEARFGAALIDQVAGAPVGLLSDGLTPCGGPVLGVAIPLGPFFAIDVSGRDVLCFFQSRTEQELGLAVGFEMTLPEGRAR